MPSVSDLAPLIVAGVAAASGLLMLAYYVRQAHSGERRAALEAKRRNGFDREP